MNREIEELLREIEETEEVVNIEKGEVIDEVIFYENIFGDVYVNGTTDAF